MRNIGHLLFSLLMLTSCSAQYNIAGNSTVSTLDGRMLYLRVSPDGNAYNSVDSCQVIHGRFKFMGDIDSIVVAHLYMDNQSMMPVVLENGNLAIEVNNIQQRVTGGPLNDKLYHFIELKTRLENELWELDQECLRMMRQGHTIKEIHQEIGPKSKKLNDEIETLETQFIIENYNNALGPACFMLLFGQYPIPVMTDQIRHILASAPERFKQNPQVKKYIREAQLNKEHEAEPQIPVDEEIPLY